MKTAIVTCADMRNYNSNVESEDDLVFNYFKAQGLNVSFQVWDDPSVEWKSFDNLLIKSPWDYFDKADQFYNWLDTIKALQLKVYNPIDTIRWNADKIYLQDIADAGFSIVPTYWINQNSSFNPQTYFEKTGKDRIIFKPRVSGGSKNTFAISKNNQDEYTARIYELLQEENYMIQPFMNEIEQQGEWSLIYFNGKLSHSVLKTAKPGDFRVQHYLGGTIHALEAPLVIKEYGDKLMASFGKDCLYGRVDGVLTDKGFALMELELIEPFLFLFTEQEAISRYYKAFLSLQK